MLWLPLTLLLFHSAQGSLHLLGHCFHFYPHPPDGKPVLFPRELWGLVMICLSLDFYQCLSLCPNSCVAPELDCPSWERTNTWRKGLSSLKHRMNFSFFKFEARTTRVEWGLPSLALEIQASMQHPPGDSKI